MHIVCLVKENKFIKMKGISSFKISLMSVPIWGCAAASSLAVIQRYQAKTLRQITDAPW